jgi:NAD(P)-dependent dehydrogenase (short-subunit alcohol dehydrogenase family)
MARLENRIAVITGAGSGIGLETAKLFAREGAKLMLAERNEKTLQQAVKLVGEERAAHFVADVSKPEDNERLVKAAEDKFGGIKARGVGNSAYITSKHAEIGLMRSAAAECAPHDIRVNCVLPGPTETRMVRNIEEGRSPGAPEKAREMIVAGLPFKRYGTPEEIANVILFLASDEASICTGGVYVADGGLSAV